MRIHAVIFDVYGTLLELGSAPGSAETRLRWESLCREHLATFPPPNPAELSAACETIITREYAVARGLGIGHPEIFWPDVVAEVLPEVGRLPAGVSDAFLTGLAGLSRSVRLAKGAGWAFPRRSSPTSWTSKHRHP